MAEWQAILEPPKIPELIYLSKPLTHKRTRFPQYFNVESGFVF